MANKKENDQYYISYGVGFGLLFGSLAGVFLNNIALWSGIGLLLGIIIGALMDFSKRKG